MATVTISLLNADVLVSTIDDLHFQPQLHASVFPVLALLNIPSNQHLPIDCLAIFL
jgi:hypothetical protein